MKKIKNISIPAINELVKKIQDEILEGKQRAEIAVENEKTITYWKIGKHINRHLLENTDRAGYGDELFKRLGEKLGIGQRTLYRAVKFYENHPNILSARTKLSWTHYRMLQGVKSEEKRKELEQKVINEKLSTRDLNRIIENQSDMKSNKKTSNLNYPIDRGVPLVYKLKYVDIEDNQVLQIDCGFKIYNNSHEKSISKYEENTILQISNKNGRYSISQSEENKSNIYTYKAYIKEILDGDTIWMNLYPGFNTWTSQKLRLRNINAPDINTKEGKKVKDYIALKLNPCKFVIVKTHYRDKFTRYLVDIFYDKNITDEYELAEKGKLLNLELLEKGLVSRY